MVIGNKESMMRISRNDVMDFHSSYYRPNRTIISIAGAISLKGAKGLINKNFGDWPTKEKNQINKYLHPEKIAIVTVANLEEAKVN